MSALRHRRGAHADAGTEDRELTQSLLAEHEASDELPVRPPSTQLIPYQPFSLDSFLHQVWSSWRLLLQAIADCMAYLLGGEPKLSIMQQERLYQIQSSLAVTFDSANEEHLGELQRLWAVSFPDTPYTQLKNEQWKDMGWQGDDPTTDVRGAGLLGVQQLLYLSDAHADTFQRLLHKRDGVRVEWEYPFAAAGINLTFSLAQLLDLQKPGHIPRSAAGRALLSLLRDDARAFDELYVAAFELLDREWLARRASYMEFPTVLAAVKAAMTEAMTAHPRSVLDVRRLLL